VFITNSNLVNIQEEVDVVPSECDIMDTNTNVQVVFALPSVVDWLPHCGHVKCTVHRKTWQVLRKQSLFTLQSIHYKILSYLPLMQQQAICKAGGLWNLLTTICCEKGVTILKLPLTVASDPPVDKPPVVDNTTKYDKVLLRVAADGRWSKPRGYNSENGTTTIVDITSGKVLAVEHMNRERTKARPYHNYQGSAKAMEVHGLERCIDTLHKNGFDIGEFIHDCDAGSTNVVKSKCVVAIEG
jgi:hypothetical protein